MQLAVNQGKDAKGLPGTYKLGAWYNSDRFADAFDLAGPAAQPPGVLVGVANPRRGNASLYGTLDQIVYRPASEQDGGLAVTARAMVAPADRNLVDLFLQGGLVQKGVFGRSGDSLGIAVEWAHIGGRARAGAAAADPTAPPRTPETVIEATYQMQVEPWWQVQPDLQLVLDPGGGLADPDHPTRRIGSAVVLGLRSVVTF